VKLAAEYANDAERRSLADQGSRDLRPLPGVVAIAVGLPADPNSAAA
jgi:hypothetical protein